MIARRWLRWVAPTAAFIGLPILVAAVRLSELDRGQLQLLPPAEEMPPDPAALLAG
jgi:hypothetical protein